MAGGDMFNSNFQKAMRKIRKGSIVGVRKATAYVKKESMKNTPVNFGDLRAGHYTEVQVSIAGVVGEVGTVADYAVAVHENLDPSSGVARTGQGAKGNYWDTGKPKFLELAVSENKSEIGRIIQQSAKLK